MGRWAWCSDSFDFDHDGYSDLYIANGYISGQPTSPYGSADVSSFFWRQVVANSPPSATPSENYELGWNAINELIRSDASWNGYERNILYLNNHDGTFSDLSAIAGLDFPDDSRAFALADIDHDGRLEIVLKNRNAPQLRILHNTMKTLGNSISFRLRGKKSNRDAIGTSILLEADGHRQTKYLQAGSGFLSQHSKELFFGVGKAQIDLRATVRWPSGLTRKSLSTCRQTIGSNLKKVPRRFAAKPFVGFPESYLHPDDPNKFESLPASAETWLLEPLTAPDFSLPDLSGKVLDLRSFRGGFVILNFWKATAPACIEQLRVFDTNHASLASNGPSRLGRQRR